MAIGSAVAAFIGLGAQTIASEKLYKQQKESQAIQEKAIADAEAKQDAADLEAEQTRLESLATNVSGESARIAKSDFGVDSVASQKIKTSTTINKTKEEDESFNPFYTRGLV